VERQKVLAELWQRKIISPESDHWGPEETTLLERMRSAERAGAAGFLKARLRSLKNLFVSPPTGSSSSLGSLGIPRARLTREGYERYIFLKAQEARAYFERKNMDAKWVFSLRDMEGWPLFDSQGLLTEAGEALYLRVLAGQRVQWKSLSGEVFSSHRIPPGSPPSEKYP
jgi:hypothetical protein